MKILLADKKGIATSARKEVLEDRFHYDVDSVSTFEEFKALYAAGKYHIVIVDFTMESGREVLDLIDRIDAKQRVIILSASEDYSEHKGCAYCVEHHYRRRLKEPIGILELGNLIRDFDYTRCAFYHE